MDTRKVCDALDTSNPTNPTNPTGTVITRNLIELVKILEEDPSIVLARFDKTHDLSSCWLNNTLLQLAFGKSDYVICHILAPFYVKACGSLQEGKKIFLQQLEEKFSTEPDEEKKQAIKTQVAAIIAPVIAAISVEVFDKSIVPTISRPHKRLTPSVATKEVLKNYKEKLTLLLPTEINEGRFFHSEILIEAYKLLDQMLGEWNYNQRILYEDAVLAPILSHVPVMDAQHFSHGLTSKEVVNPFKGSLKVQNEEEYYYECLKKSSWELDVDSSYLDPRSGFTASYLPLGLRLGPDKNVSTTKIVEAYYLECEKQLALVMQGKLFEEDLTLGIKARIESLLAPLALLTEVKTLAIDTENLSKTELKITQTSRIVIS